MQRIALPALIWFLFTSVAFALPLAELVETAPARAVPANEETTPAGIKVSKQRKGELFEITVSNESSQPAALQKVVIADIPHGFPRDASFYGEGFSMFCSTVGTIGKMEDGDSSYTDENHYRLPQPGGYRTVYNYLRVTPEGAPATLVGFTSCKRFNGRFNINDTRLQIEIDTENLTLAPGERWNLEELMVVSGKSGADLMETFAGRINVHHPRLAWPKAPTGWCSFYAYGWTLSADMILTTIESFKKNLPELRYIQIDDGYQPWMGDWLESTDLFPGGVRSMIETIRREGFEPAIWVAPFIASPESRLFREHPDWFIKDGKGAPLNSKDVTFGGWKQGPWYMLDGTHPEALAYIEQVFKTMRSWGVTYFKLDANIWGSLPFGHHHDPNATSVEALRSGMEAVLRGAGTGSFILGCNHAYWPSLGLLHGSRTSFDVNRSFGAFTRVARQNLLRNWMNDRLWWNDPDCLLLDFPVNPVKIKGPDGKLREPARVTPNEASFHRAATFAAGGMMLSGDKVTEYTPKEWELLRRAINGPYRAARFESAHLDMGWVDDAGAGRRFAVLLNWSQEPVKRSIPFDSPVHVTDFWTSEEIAVSGNHCRIDLAPASGRVLVFESR